MHRRTLFGALGLAAITITSPAFADDDKEAIAARVEAFRQAQLKATAESLGALAAAELSYSHSDGRVEDRATFITNATSGKSPFTSIEYRDPSIAIVGPNAVVRFHWVAEQRVAADGRIVPTNLHILMVWQKQPDGWKLLARSATKL